MPINIDHSLKLTYEDLKQIPEDYTYRHEIIYGIHVATIDLSAVWKPDSSTEARP